MKKLSVILRGLLSACVMFYSSVGVCEEVVPLAFINGTLIDGTGAEPVANGVLVIQQDRILAVGTADAVEIPAEAKCMDLQGATILPGFINAHVHEGFNPDNLKAWAQGGVTTVRDLGAASLDHLSSLKALRSDPQNARLVAVGMFLNVPGGYPAVPWGGPIVEVTSPEDAAQKTRDVLQKGADVIKIALETGLTFNRHIPTLTPEEAAAIVHVAHEHGTLVTAHITASRDLELALEAGIDEIAHMMRDILPAELAERIADRGMYWVPTLELWKGVGQYAAAIQNLRKFVEAGGNVALGTDYAGYRTKFDLGMPITEIEMMLKAGMTPMQIIVAATQHAAHACNLEQEIGTLEAGKVADVLVVKGNPLEDMHALLDVALVIHNGVIIRNNN